MAPDGARYWFPAKRHGSGWSFPRTWQGWVVLLLYTAVVGVAAVAGRDAIPVVVVATLGLLVVCLRMGEPARWRWGSDE